MVEFALVLPVFFLLVFGFLDVARYWQAKTALQQAAWEGMNELAVNRDIKKLGSTNPDDVTEYQAAYDAIRARIRSRAALLALTAGGNADNIDEVFPSMPPSADELHKVPVEITVAADFHGTFLPFHFKMSSQTSGYIETFRMTSQPLITDCHGNPFDSTDPPGDPEEYNTWCPCNGGFTTEDDEGCLCSSEYSMGAVGTVMMTDDSGNPFCGCPTGTERRETVNPDASNNDEENQAYLNSGAICCPPDSPVTCPGGTKRQYFVDYVVATACSCGCGSGASDDGSGNCVCSNPNMEYRYPGTNYAFCGCRTDLPACAGNTIIGYRDPTTCNCVCNHSNQVHPDTGLCYCAKTQQGCIDANPNSRLNYNQCKCYSCAAGQAFGANGAGSNTCNCTSTAASAGCRSDQVLNTSTSCNCACPTGTAESSGKCCPTSTTNMGGICCPSGATNNGGVCDCGPGRQVSADGKKCECTLTCSNGYTLSDNGSTCSCICGANRTEVQGTSYCSPIVLDCKASCTFSPDGSCSNCPPG